MRPDNTTDDDPTVAEIFDLDYEIAADTVWIWIKRGFGFGSGWLVAQTIYRIFEAIGGRFG